MRRLVGITSAVLAVALAVPAFAGSDHGKSKSAKCTEDAQTCLNHMAAKRNKGYMGVEVDKAENGQKVTKVLPETPAQEAGIEVGDVLLTRNGIKLTDYEALKADKDSWSVGAQVTYTLLRNSEEKKVAVTLVAVPEQVYAAMVGAHMIADHMVVPTAAATEAKSEKAMMKAASSDKK